MKVLSRIEQLEKINNELMPLKKDYDILRRQINNSMYSMDEIGKDVIEEYNMTVSKIKMLEERLNRQ